MSNDCPPGDSLLLVLCSPSGAGKTTLRKRLLAEFSDLRFSISHTTRAPRPSESDGREYHFVDRPKFEAMATSGAFVEWAEVHGNLYGTSVREVESARATTRGVVFDIDYQGARQVRAKMPDAVTVFLLPPSMRELERRLRARGDEAETSVRRRLRNAPGEIEQYGFFDYLIVNDDLDDAFDALRAVVVAERCRRPRVAPLAERLLAECKTGGW